MSNGGRKPEGKDDTRGYERIRLSNLCCTYVCIHVCICVYIHTYIHIYMIYVCICFNLGPAPLLRAHRDSAAAFRESPGKRRLREVQFRRREPNAGALITRIRFWGPLYCKYNKEPPIVLAIIQAPAVNCAKTLPLGGEILGRGRVLSAGVFEADQLQP